MDRYPPRPARPGSRRTLGISWLLASLMVVATTGQSTAQQLPSNPPARGAQKLPAPRVNTRASGATATPEKVGPATPQAAGGPVARQATAPPRPAVTGQPNAVQQPPPAPAAPFELTPEEQADLDQMLIAWEKRSQKITLFRCKLKRWEYDKVFNKTTIALGELKYKSPDRGLYRVWDEKTNDWIEDWRCDGKSIYEFNFPKKQLIERHLPPQLQGKAIADGPLPFIFGAKADTLKERYFLRLKQPSEGNQEKICIEAFPRLQADAANFQRAELLLTQQGMMPFALQLDLPNGKSSTVHQFYDIKTNDLVGDLLLRDFDAPRTPLLWKKIVEGDGGPPDDAEPSVTTVPAPSKPAQQAQNADAKTRR